MIDQFHIESGVIIPECSKGRPKKRAVAEKAANDIREGKFNCIFKAASAYYNEHLEQTGYKLDGKKDFIRYIVEDLNKEPKTMNVYRALSKRSRKRNEQATVKEHRSKKLYDEIKRLCPSVKLFERNGLVNNFV